jgi:hypothetical protein
MEVYCTFKLFNIFFIQIIVDAYGHDIGKA